ncbi:hypothetical protein D3C71_1191250 [compost metagenome]
MLKRGGGLLVSTLTGVTILAMLVMLLRQASMIGHGSRLPCLKHGMKMKLSQKRYMTFRQLLFGIEKSLVFPRELLPIRSFWNLKGFALAENFISMENLLVVMKMALWQQDLIFRT